MSSEIDKGTRFDVLLPKAPDDDALQSLTLSRSPVTRQDS